MSRFYRFRPEVAGGMGPRTELDPSTHPPRVSRLHYEFAGWDGDDLVETFPCYLVSEYLAGALRGAALDGVAFKPVEVTVDRQFASHFPERAGSLPGWERLVPSGQPWRSDLWVDETANLHGSEHFARIATRFHLEHCEIVEVVPAQGSS